MEKRVHQASKLDASADSASSSSGVNNPLLPTLTFPSEGSRIFRIHPLCDLARVHQSLGTFNGGLESLLPVLPVRTCCCCSVASSSSLSRRATKSDMRGLDRVFNTGCGSRRVAFRIRRASRSCCMISRANVSVSLLSKACVPATLLPEPRVSSSCACTFCIVSLNCSDSGRVAAVLLCRSVTEREW